MKAAFIRQTGPPDNIAYGDLPAPELKDSEVLVRVRAVSVNPVDTYIRSGLFAMDLPMPYVVGCDLAGVVEAVGARATRFRPGDRVWGSNQGLLGRQGTFSELAAVDECWLYPTPDGVDDKDAAAIALVGITAHLGLFRDAKLRAGETVFVHGGAGGVGACVVQMAKAAGARAVATVGSDEKAETCRRLGADRVIQYKKEDVGEALQRFAPQGVNVWFETMHEQNFVEILDHLAPCGRIVLIAGRGSRPAFPVGPFYLNGCSMFGFAMFKAPPDQQRTCAEAMNRWMAEGRLRATIGRVMRLSEAAAAHRLQEDNTIRGAGTLSGKIVLEP